MRLVGSVGTDHHPFPRLLEWVHSAQTELGFEALVQRGATDPHPSLPTVDYLPAAELEAAMAAADVVVCHGGPGTMSLAMRCGHRPIVIPRDPQRGEHVDDHQQRYTAKLHGEGVIDIAADEAELVVLIRAASVRAPLVGDDDAGVERAVERFGELVEQLVNGTLPRRRLRDRVLVRRVP